MDEERDVIYEEIEDGEGNAVVIALAPGSNHLSIVCSEFATIRAGAELKKSELERLIEALHRAAVLIA